jgi:lipoprotein signal peptidase
MAPARRLGLVPLIPALLWAACVALAVIGGRFESSGQALRALWPGVLAWMVFSLLNEAERRQGRLAPLPWLVMLALLVVGLDLLAKAWLEANLPYRVVVPFAGEWLYLFRAHNPHGTWIGPRDMVPLVTLFDLVVVFAAIPVYRYWHAHARRSVWIDVAFVGVFGGALGAAADLLLRGYIVDYMLLPGMPIADLKDQLLNLGLAAMAVETVASRMTGQPAASGQAS